MLIEYLGAVERRRVRPNVDEIEHAERDDARQLVQFPKQERIRDFYRHPVIAVRSNIEFVEILCIIGVPGNPNAIVFIISAK